MMAAPTRVLVDRTTRARALSLFSLGAMVTVAYRKESKGGDGELVPPVLLAAFSWPDDIEAIVVIEPDRQAAMRLAGLAVRRCEERARQADEPDIALGQPFALVAVNCREIGMGMPNLDLGGGTNASILFRTERRIDVHAWEEILFRHFGAANERGERGENTDGWSDGAYAEVQAKFGGKWLERPKRITIDFDAKHRLSGAGEA